MHTIARTSILILGFGFGLVACGGGGDDDLDPDIVTSIPPGDATGSAASGTYQMQTVTTGCSGTCRIDVDGFTYSACDVGTRLDDSFTVTQTGGALAIDVPDNDYVSQLAGGIDADGSFDVGGLRTQEGGAVTITARSIGTLIGEVMTATARLRVKGMGLNCVIEADADGTRD